MTTTNIGSYEARRQDFEWALSERELGYEPGGTLNIGWHCSDRICARGDGATTALIWEGSAGAVHTYSYDDLRVLSNSIATYLTGLGVKPGERVCLFMDKVPELYIGFIGILKMGAVNLLRSMTPPASIGTTNVEIALSFSRT